jgi:putative protein-disulfide isomerase
LKVELFYITDTYCIWCYGFGAAMEQVAQDYEDRVDIRVVNGGMIPTDVPLPGLFRPYPDPVGLHQRVTSMSGQAFGKAYLDEIEALKTSKLILNSTTPARAILALKLLGVEDELGVAKAIQHAYYVEGRDLQDIATYEPIAAQFGIGFAAFKETFERPEPARAVMEERRLVEQLGIRGFPALLLRSSDDQFVMVAHGFLPADTLRINLEKTLRLHGPADEPAGQVCGLDGKGC